jgi:hypothetical protein
MGFKIGDRVEVNYPVDDFQGHIGIVKKIITDTELTEQSYQNLPKQVLSAS